MRLVLDTNIAVSGLLWGGTPGRLIDAAPLGEATLITSKPLLAELDRVVRRPKISRRLDHSHIGVDELIQGYVALTEIVIPAVIAPTILRDLADDQVLATALAGGADLIVSGDKDVLSLDAFGSIRIVQAITTLTLLQ